MSKTISMIAVVTLLFAAAGPVAAAPETAQPETLSRAQVRAELAAASSSGELYAMGGEDSGSEWLARQARPSTQTRQQVRLEMASACAGDCATMYGEDSGSFALAARASASTLTRAEVVAELMKALRAERPWAYEKEDDMSTKRAAAGTIDSGSLSYAGPNLGTAPDPADASKTAAS